MASRIKGITVEINGSTTGLDKALRETTSSINKTQAALKDVNRLLKEKVADKEQLVTYKHQGFWAPVETHHDRFNMENLWNAGVAPWLKAEK